MVLSFDQAVETASLDIGLVTSCSAVLTADTITRIGGASGASLLQCVWSSASQFQVLLNANSFPTYPRAGMVVSLRDGSVCAAGCGGNAQACCSRNTATTITLTEISSDAERPTARLNAPQNINSCAPTLQLDTSGSTNGGVFPLLKRVVVDSQTRNADAINAELLLQMRTNDASSCESRGGLEYCAFNILLLPILGSGLVDGQLNFVLSVQSLWGVEANATGASVVVSADAPTVLVSAPTEAFRSAPLALQSSITHGCAGGTLSSMSYVWRVLNAAGSALSLSGLERRTLSIPPNSLPADETVTAIFSASFDAAPNTRYEASTTIRIQSSALVARISGGSARLIGVSEQLLLDGSSSYDPDSSDTTLTFTWSCTSAGASCVHAVTGSGLYASDDWRTSLGTLTIRAGALASTASYTFRLLVSAGTRPSAMTTVTITTQAEIPPSVTISRASSAAGVSATRVLRLVGNVDAGLQVAWTVTSGSSKCSTGEQDCVGSSQPNYCCATSADRALPSTVNLVGHNLIVPSGQLLEGATYTFTLAAYSASNTRGFTELSLTVNRPPWGGRSTFGRSPATGVVLSTTFTLSADGWVDDAEDLPLTYSFFYLEAASVPSGDWPTSEVPSNALPLAPATYAPVLTTTIPVQADNGDLRIFATASDAYSVALSTPLTVTTNWGQATNTAAAATTVASTVVSNNLASALAVDDAGAVQQAVGAAAQLLTQSATMAADSSDAAAEVTATRTSLRGQLISGLTSAAVGSDATITVTEVAAQGSLAQQITSEPSELDSGSRIAAAALATTLASQLAMNAASATSETLDAPTSLTGVLSNVLQGSGVEGVGGSEMVDGVQIVSRAVEVTRRRLSADSTPSAPPSMPPSMPPSVPAVPNVTYVNVTVNVTEMNMIADAVERSVGQLTAALLSGSVEGEEYVVNSPLVSLFARRAAPSDLVNATFTPSGGNTSTLAPGSTVVRLPSSIGHGDAALDVQLSSFGTNLRGYSPSAKTICQGAPGSGSGLCFNGIASNSTTLTLRRGAEELTTANVSDPFILGFTIELPAGLEATSPYCYGPQAIAQCQDTIRQQQAQLTYVLMRCRMQAKNQLWSGLSSTVGPRLELCKGYVLEANDTLNAEYSNCSNTPVSCNGRGNCTGGTGGVNGTGDICVCEEGWLGGQCDYRPECEYWDPALGEFSTAGCTLRSFDPITGQVFCACNHLTEFSTVIQSILYSNEARPSTNDPPKGCEMLAHPCLIGD